MAGAAANLTINHLDNSEVLHSLNKDFKKRAATTSKDILASSKQAAVTALVNLPYPTTKQVNALTLPEENKHEVMQQLPHTEVIAASVSYEFPTGGDGGNFKVTINPVTGEIEGNFNGNAGNAATGGVMNANYPLNAFPTERLSVAATPQVIENDDGSKDVWLWADLQYSTHHSMDVPYFNTGEFAFESVGGRSHALWLCQITNYNADTLSFDAGSTFNAFRVSYGLVHDSILDDRVGFHVCMRIFWDWKYRLNPGQGLAAAYKFFLHNAGDLTAELMDKWYETTNYDPQSDANLDAAYAAFLQDGYIMDPHCSSVDKQ